jgi:hypothetical protein
MSSNSIVRISARFDNYPNVHPVQFINLFINNFRKYQLFLQTYIVVTISIETRRRYPLKISNPWKSQIYKTIKKCIYSFSAQSYFNTYWHLFTNFKSSYRTMRIRVEIIFLKINSPSEYYMNLSIPNTLF